MQPSSNATRSLSSEIVGRSKLASVKPSMAPKHDARRSNAWVLILSLGLLQSAGWAQEPRLPGTIPPVTMPPINSAVVAPLNESNASTPRIIGVQIKGNQRVSKNKILEKLQTRPDRDFSPDLLQADVQELMLMKEFRNVRPYVAEQDEGVLVTFEVIEKPRVTQVNFIGNRAITNRALIKEAAIKEGDPLDLYTVRLAQQRLEDLYKRKGFPQTEVTVVEMRAIVKSHSSSTKIRCVKSSMSNLLETRSFQGPGLDHSSRANRVGSLRSIALGIPRKNW